MHAKKRKLEAQFEDEKREMREQIGQQNQGMKLRLFELVMST